MRALLWSAGAVVVAWVGAWLWMSERSHHDCNIGASTSQCEDLDEALIFLAFIGLPGLLVLLGLLLIFAVKRRDRR